MKYKITIIFYLALFSTCFSQALITGKVLDSFTLLPVPNVEISTENKERTVTNAEGKFYLNYTGGTVLLYSPNYKIKEVKDLQNGAEISLTQLKVKEIEVVSIESYRSTIEKIYEKVPTNYSFSSYSENFYLRGIAKRNNEIFKIVDLAGRVSRNTLIKNSKQKELNYKVAITNARKAGKVFKSADFEYFKLFSLKELLLQANPLFIDAKAYNFYKMELLDSLYSKLYFSDKNNSFTGYYIVGSKDMSIVSINYQREEDADFQTKQGFRWRTTNRDISINFSYSPSLKKYTQSNCLLKYTLELFNDKNEKTVYNVEYQLVFSNPNNYSVSSNTPINKEIFEISADYNEEFWKKQNQLLLTQEMKKFMENLKDNKEYKAILSK